MVIFPYKFAFIASITPKGKFASDSNTPDNSTPAVKVLGCMGMLLMVWLLESV